jgi:hypothetical protein
VSKINSSGTLQWVKQQSVSNTSSDDLYPSIAADTAGNAYVSYHTPGTITGGTTTANVSAANLIAKNISDEDRPFWSEITYYDVEDIKNSKSQSIRLLAQEYSIQTALELRKLLNP